MANLTEDKKRQVDEILLEAKGLYTAILLCKPPASLGLAIRDARPWDRLTEPEITALFSVIVQLRKAALSAMPPGSELPPAAPAPAPEMAPKAATPTVEAPKKKTSEMGPSTQKTGT